MAKLNTRNFPEQKSLTKTDVVIVLGDFGLLWTETPDKEEIWWTRNLAERRFTTLFLDGNHENFVRLASLPEEERFGAPVGVVREGIFHLKRGYLYTVGEMRLFVMGGAASTDKECRVAYESWWPEEIPSEIEMQRAMNTITNCGGSVDYVLTHTCPGRIAPQVSNKVRERYGGNPSPAAYTQDPTCSFLDRVDKTLDFKAWHFGHFHIDAVFGGKYACHYENPPQQIA